MDDLEYTTLADRYFLRKLAGTGGMAQVYQAWDQLRGTEMAIKVIHDLRFFESFVREAVALRDIAHPNIVRFYSVEKDDEKGIIFIVMEWVEGRDLQRILKKRGGPLGIGEVTSILQGIQRALQYAHKLGICHCDIKPANILLKDADDQPVLSDFGLAHVAHDKGAGGTLAFMAPELFIKGGEYSVSSDIYALGVTLYQLLSGHLPFHGDTKDRLIREHMGKTPPRIQSFNPKVPDGIARVIEKALAKNPSQRQGSVMELWSEFSRHTGWETREGPDLTSILRGLSGERIGQKISISGQGITIGRSKRNLFRLRHPSISRYHATIIWKQGRYCIQDLGSTTGTFVNGRRILPHKMIHLRNGDKIKLGASEILEFRTR